MATYATQLVERIQHGMKEAFCASIVWMLERALWIVLLVWLIPELPLRASRSEPLPAEA